MKALLIMIATVTGLCAVGVAVCVQLSFYMGKMSCELEQYRKSDKVQVVT